MLAEIIWSGYRMGVAGCPDRYFEDTSSVSFWRSVIYGFEALKTALLFRLCKRGFFSCSIIRK